MTDKPRNPIPDWLTIDLTTIIISGIIIGAVVWIAP
jgi:hypothetical protein